MHHLGCIRGDRDVPGTEQGNCRCPERPGCWGSPDVADAEPGARPLYCSVDPRFYYPQTLPLRWNLGYLGTYSPDRQPALDRLLLQVAQACPEARFVVAGPQYPADIAWNNVHRIEHLPPGSHRAFYNEQAFTLNITRADMIRAGYSPSVRLFEAAACGVPIISDWWEGLDSFFTPGREILIAHDATDVLAALRETTEEKRHAIGMRARMKVLSAHTAAHRAAELEGYVREIRSLNHDYSHS